MERSARSYIGECVCGGGGGGGPWRDLGAAWGPPWRPIVGYLQRLMIDFIIGDAADVSS